MARYINPFTDWGFKHIFGQEITNSSSEFCKCGLNHRARRIQSSSFRIAEPQPMMSISSCKANAIRLARIAEPQLMMSIKAQVFYLARGNALGKIEHSCDALQGQK